MSTHTPGPWNLVSQRANAASGSPVLSEIWNGNYVVARLGALHTEQAVTDARLIAAAPDLLAALRDAADLIRTYDKGNPSDPTGWDNHELLDHWLAITDVIAKATGVPANQQYGVRVSRARAAIAKAEGAP